MGTRIKIMSRKTMLAILAALGSILGFLNGWFELGLNVTALMATVTALFLWVFFEARLDIKRLLGQIKSQSNKFADPRFWLALAMVLIEVLNEAFALKLPVEVIIIVLTALMGLLFKKQEEQEAEIT